MLTLIWYYFLIVSLLFVFFSSFELFSCQAVYMSTTVPQNIKGCNIMGSHLPTRNSLRHSRMLVGKKNFQGNAQIFHSSLISSNFSYSFDFDFVLFILLTLSHSLYLPNDLTHFIFAYNDQLDDAIR